MKAKCKGCGSTNTRLIDNESLYFPKEDESPESKTFDTEIYAEYICEDCGDTHKVMGVIDWKF